MSDSIRGAREIVWRPVSALRGYEKNSRTHTPEQVSKVAASITEFGFTNPILVDENLGVIAGHCRLDAAGKLGLAEVPTIQLPYLSEAQRRALVIADNRLALDAGWDNEVLAAELAELSDAGFDLGVVGFTDDELNAIAGVEDDSPEPERKPKTTTDFKYQEQFGVIVICDNERHQEEIYERLHSEGLQVRVVKT